MLILGAGSQAQVVADILLARGDVEIVGFIDIGKDVSRVGQTILGYPVLGFMGELARLVRDTGTRSGAVAIGDNLIRSELLEQGFIAGLEFPAIIHPSAVISAQAVLGPGTVVAAQAVVGTGATIGPGGIINTCASVDHHCVLGRCVHIAVGAHLPGNVKVGDFTTLGAGSCATPGVSIGKHVRIGAGAAVIRDIPDNCTAVGVPAIEKQATATTVISPSAVRTPPSV